MVRTLIFLISLGLFWVLLSGMFVPFLLAAGFGSAVAVLLLSRSMDAVGDQNTATPLHWGRFALYCPWLIREIIVAAWDVTKRILHPKLPISPTLTEFSPLQTTELGLVIHANSITLTPGTISVEVEPGRFLIHALSQEGAASLAGSEMDRRCAAMEVH